MHAPCQGRNQTVIRMTGFWSDMLLRYARTPLALQSGFILPVDCLHAAGLVSPILLFVSVFICSQYGVDTGVGS